MMYVRVKGKDMQVNKFRQYSSQSGFTLLELMIVVAIMGIIASIAIPAYQDYVKKGKAAEATSILSDLRVKMEQYYQDNRTYDSSSFCTPVNGDKYFSYDCSVTPSAAAYTIRAQGIAAEGMAGFEYTVDQDNNKTSKYDGAVGANCWLTNKSGSC